MFPVLMFAPALALECDQLDSEICTATNGISASLEDLAGRPVVHAGAAKRLREETVYGRLAGVSRNLALRGCSVDGWSAGLYGEENARWRGVYGESEELGTWSGTYDRTERVVDGVWTAQGQSGTAGTAFGSFNKNGQLVADLDGERLLAGIWIRQAGARGVFAILHATCEMPLFEVADAVFQGKPAVAPPVCPDLTFSADEAVSVADFNIKSAAGDPLAPVGVRLIDGDGRTLLSASPPPSAFELQSTTTFLDPRGIAMPRIEAVVRDAAGDATTCSFAVEPVSRVVCRQGPLKRTIVGNVESVELSLADDCTVLEGDASILDITDVTTPSGEPVEWAPQLGGKAEVFGIETGVTELVAKDGNGDPIRFTITVRDSWGRLAGETNELPEGGGTLDLAPILESLGGGDDPLEPVSVELLAPDLSTIVASDVVSDELVVPRALVEQQGDVVVTPTLLLTVRRGDVEEVLRYDVPVDRAPYCRADGPMSIDSSGTARMPLDWCIDPEGEPIEVVSVTTEGGEEVAFTQQGDALVFSQLERGDPIRFTIEMRDSWSVVPPTIGVGSFTIEVRDEFDAL